MEFFDKTMTQVNNFYNGEGKLKGHFMEFAGCTGFALITHSVGVGSMQGAIAYAVLFTLFRTQFKHCFHSNPAFIFADWLSGRCGDDCTVFDVFNRVMFQIFGYAFGFFLGGHIGLTAHVQSTQSAGLSNMLFDEVISVGIMGWMWLHIHGKNNGEQGWNDFMGFAVGIAVYLGYLLKLDGAHLNASIFAGEDFGKQIGFWHENGWTINDWAQFFAPLLAVFVTSLVYSFYNKK